MLKNISEKPWNSRNNWDLGKGPRHPDHRSGQTCTTTLRGTLCSRLPHRSSGPPKEFPTLSKEKDSIDINTVCKDFVPTCHQLRMLKLPPVLVWHQTSFTIVFAEALGLTAIYHSSCTGNENHWGRLKNLRTMHITLYDVQGGIPFTEVHLTCNLQTSDKSGTAKPELPTFPFHTAGVSE